MNTKDNSQNQLVKDCIFESLMILMKKKEFKNITITDITNKAGVSRMAYYRNYNYKEDIIITYLDKLFEQYLSEIENYKDHNIYQFAYNFFSYFSRQESMILTLIKANMQTLLLNRFDKYLYLLLNDIFNKNTKKITKKYDIDFLSGGLYKILIHWIEDGKRESNEEMATLFCNFLKLK